jgi:hypothetical protein
LLTIAASFIFSHPYNAEFSLGPLNTDSIFVPCVCNIVATWLGKFNEGAQGGGGTGGDIEMQIAELWRTVLIRRSHQVAPLVRTKVPPAATAATATTTITITTTTNITTTTSRPRSPHHYGGTTVTTINNHDLDAPCTGFFFTCSHVLTLVYQMHIFAGGRCVGSLCDFGSVAGHSAQKQSRDDRQHAQGLGLVGAVGDQG